MKRFRIIPSLLIHEGGLVKTTAFKKPNYIGDPINAVKIFNDKECDELMFLDIDASKESKAPDLDKIREIAREAFMPISYGGGISTLEQAKAILKAGIEKVVLNTQAFKNPGLVKEIAEVFGAQSVVVCIDVKKTWLGKERAWILGGTKDTGMDPVEAARQAESWGAGEILIQDIDREGTYKGYNLELIRKVAQAVTIPVVALGGAASHEDLAKPIESGASAVAAGSIFVYQGAQRGILISYPSRYFEGK